LSEFDIVVRLLFKWIAIALVLAAVVAFFASGYYPVTTACLAKTYFRDVDPYCAEARSDDKTAAVSSEAYSSQMKEKRREAKRLEEAAKKPANSP